jgi:hypothetical protein
LAFTLSCLPSQAAFHQLAIEHPRDKSLAPPRYRAFSGPVGSGKTRTLCDHLLLLAYENPNSMGLLGAATVPLLRDSALHILHERLEDHRIPFKERKSEQTIILTEPNTKLLYRPVENFDRLRGMNLAFFGIDELTYAPEAAWLQLEARLRDPHAKRKAGLASFTPLGFNWVYRKFIENPSPEYAAIRAKAFENTFLDAGYYKGLLNSYSAKFARQEVFGDYLDVFSGQAYDSFGSKPGENIWTRNGPNYDGFLPCTFRPDRPLLWALDFNITPATSVLAQTVSHTPVPSNPFAARGPNPAIGGTDKQLNILDEIYAPDINTEQHCEIFYNRFLQEIRPKLRPGTPLHIVIYGDPAGDRRETSASESDYAIIRRFFGRHSHEFRFEQRVASSHPTQKDRVNAVNAMLCNYQGQRRTAIHERCKRVIQDLREHTWSKDGSGNSLPLLSTKRPDIGHISDALGYLVHFEFAIRGTAGYKKGFIG